MQSTRRSLRGIIALVAASCFAFTPQPPSIALTGEIKTIDFLNRPDMTRPSYVKHEGPYVGAVAALSPRVQGVSRPALQAVEPIAQVVAGCAECPFCAHTAEGRRFDVWRWHDLELAKRVIRLEHVTLLDVEFTT